jgi:hypothetical protein
VDKGFLTIKSLPPVLMKLMFMTQTQTYHMFYQTGQSRSNGLDLYSGSEQFRSHRGHQLILFFFSFTGMCDDSSFQILFTWSSTIQQYIISVLSTLLNSTTSFVWSVL